MCNRNHFIIVTDSASNLTEPMLEQYDVKMISYLLEVDGEEVVCYQEGGMAYEARAKEFYDKMRAGAKTKTSLVNGARFTEFVEPYVKDGHDILFISLSGGVSGTFQACSRACEELQERYPGRKCLAVDTMGASLGEGLVVLEAAKLRDEGMDIERVRDELNVRRMKLRQIFTVDDLEYLKRGGRVSKLTAVVGTLLQVKPLLKGNDEGKIVSYAKVKGKKRALDTLAREYAETAADPKAGPVAIAHCDCLQDATYLADSIKRLTGLPEVILCTYDMCTGSYVGPGTVALFFWGNQR